MAAINFREIPPANLATGEQDTFELFARDFLEALGFRIVEGPGRGIDRGRDLLVAEKVTGMVTANERLWLVSAKHKVHSGKSVTDADEPDPIGRVRKFRATGFMGFYSTLPSSGFDDTLSKVRQDIDVFVWDAGRIEQALLRDRRVDSVFKSYFPVSHAKAVAAGSPIQYLSELVPLVCANCGKNQLEDDGIVVFVEEEIDRKEVIVDVFISCRGACDDELERHLPKSQITSWESLSDLRIPLFFMKYVMATLNNAREDPNFASDAAFGRLKDFMLAIAQSVVRDSTPAQKERIQHLMELPQWMGGLG